MNTGETSLTGSRFRGPGLGCQLTLWGLDDLLFTTELVFSELVTNAIRARYAERHGADRVTMDVY
nr:hypothetical protein OG781_02105 [Streptomyces sp. NBC_00830]